MRMVLDFATPNLESSLFKIDTTPIECSLDDLGTIQLKMVSHTSLEPLWDFLVREYHYLGYRRIIGQRLKYIVFAWGQPIAALGWKAAYLKIEARDCFIGWTKEQRGKYLNRIANNNRFLILNWIRVPNLASYLLSRNIRVISNDWHTVYGQKLLLVETFVDPKRYKGSCYKASNWIYVGNTKGYTKQGAGYKYHGSIKEIYVYVIDPNFRKIINCKKCPFPRKPPENMKMERATNMMIQQADYNPDLIPWMDLTLEVVEKVAEELVSFHKEFDDSFYRVEQRILGQYYLQGLLSNIERKNVEAIALEYLNPHEVRSLQKFVTNYRWDEEMMLARAQVLLSELIVSEGGMITLDGSDFPKKGKESVGVARQYCGNTGKIDNCQSGVFIGYTSAKGYGLIDRQLYMPEKWFTKEYEEQRKKCRIPKDISFKTKIEIALELIKNVRDTGLFPARWIGFDTTFGNDSKFRNAIDSLSMNYIAGIRSDTLVWLKRPEVGIPPYRGKGRPAKKEQVLKKDEKALHVSDIAGYTDIEWETMILGEGAKGPILARLCMMRVVEYKDRLPGKDLWLIMRKDSDGKIRYFFSNATEDISKEELKRVVIMRWPIEQCFEDGKKHLGMDHYEHRSWQGWHRHMTYVFLALLFLLRLRIRFKKNSIADFTTSTAISSRSLSRRKT